VGAAVGFMFYHDNLTYNICGILLLVFANILDCVDGSDDKKFGLSYFLFLSTLTMLRIPYPTRSFVSYLYE